MIFAMRFPRPRLPSFPAVAGLCLALLCVAQVAHANRPFLVDDARVAGQGNFELILATFVPIVDGDVENATELELIYGIIDPLEMTLILGVGVADGDFELAPPALELKTLVLDPEADEDAESAFGIGLLGGVGLPIGDGESTLLYAYVPLTWMAGSFEAHLNLGIAAAFGGFADSEWLPNLSAGAGLWFSERWIAAAEFFTGAPDGVIDYERGGRLAAGFQIHDAILLDFGAALVHARAADETFPVLDLALTWTP